MPASQFIQDLFREAPDYVILTPSYPNLLQNGGEFIRTRVQAYASRGLNGHVIVYSAPPKSRPATRSAPEGKVTIVGSDAAGDLLDRARTQGMPVLTHSPTPALSHLLHERLDGAQFAVWYHGYEVRDNRRLLFNMNTKQLALTKTYRETDNAERLSAAVPLFEDRTVAKIFVSDFQRRSAEWDVGTKAYNSHIIPNHIDTATYQPRVRRPDDARNILLLRSFKARNYANDVAIKAIEILSTRGGFNDLKFTIRGFGARFEDEVKEMRKLSNVTIQHQYSGPAEMAMMHYDNGIFLCPSRFDTQGVMLGEAMASGMVTITNPVGGIPEYTDETCSMLPRIDDPWAFADAIWHLVTHPELMPTLSRNAAHRVARQCGVEATVDKELEIIMGLAA